MTWYIELSDALSKVEGPGRRILILRVDKTGNDGGQKDKNAAWQVDKRVDKGFFLPVTQVFFQRLGLTNSSASKKAGTSDDTCSSAVRLPFRFGILSFMTTKHTDDTD